MLLNCFRNSNFLTFPEQLQAASEIEIFCKALDLKPLQSRDVLAFINKEGKTLSIEEIEKHRGFFGIMANDWLAAKENMAKNSMAAEVIKIGRWEQAVAGVVKNQNWIDRAMEDFFEQTGYKYTDMPYFAEKPNFTVTPEMKKLNAVMERFTAYCIKMKLLEHSDKSPATGNDRFYVQRAVDEIYAAFNIAHIVLGLRNHWLEIDVPYSVKEKFYKTIEKQRKAPKGKPKRPSPEDDFKRLKAKDDTKSAGNAGTGSEQSSQKAISDPNIEIMHIIDSYKKATVTKPTGGQSSMPSLKQMPQSSQKMR